MAIDLNPQFKKALDVLENTDETVLLTGEAGTGKSTLLRYFSETTKKAHIILAPTGVAALNVGGETIHSFFALPPNAHPEDIKRKSLSNAKRDLIRKLDAIIIDEISMVRADIMDLIDVRLQQVLKNRKPFGGLQLILIGDLYQLPPVLTSYEKDEFLAIYETPYFFSSFVMKETPLTYLELTKIYRQEDQDFIEVLNRVRNNTTTEQDLEFINQRYQYEYLEEMDDFTIYLATTNRIVDMVNDQKLMQLDSNIRVYEAKQTGDFPQSARPNPEILNLKKGAQIMFLNNNKDEETERYKWVNGTLGKIIDITAADKEGGPEIVVVELQNGDLVDVYPHTWQLEKYSYDDIKDEVIKTTVGTFTQYPIKLAWAVTIHKAQGKTFDRLIIDLGNFVFDYGQTYVAISRATNLKGITLKRPIKAKDIKIDPRVKEYLQMLK